jgi:hypothetical protein
MFVRFRPNVSNAAINAIVAAVNVLLHCQLSAGHTRSQGINPGVIGTPIWMNDSGIRRTQRAD